mgnify:CR=1 FL=1
MSFEFVKQLPTPQEIKEEYPLSKECIELKKKRDQEIANIFTGKSDKFIAIIGPCSADSEDAVLDYTLRLAKIQEKVADKILIIPRVYTNKPRTTGIGYKGMLHQPDPQKQSDLRGGLIAIRKMHIDVITNTGLTPADEMLYPDNYWYLEDVLSYVAVGARSVENQEHRLVSSGIEVPVGMKNPTSGDFSVMLNSVVAAQSKQTFIYRTHEVTTNGNSLTHCILRGAVNKHGQNNPNYHYEDIVRLFNMYKSRELANPALIIDANHSNSGKQYLEQIRIVKEILHNCKYNENIRSLCKGVMIESYIEPGNQKVGEGIYGKSITDACLGWNESEKLLLDMAERLDQLG